jgi:predicted RNase H-like HicB family nuclease
VLARALSLANEYALVIGRDDEVGFIGRTVEMPLVMGDGRTLDACAKAVLEATIAAIATLIELGEIPPAPASEGKRDQQVNIRLSSSEKMLLEARAKQQGFRSLSDYVRSVAMDRAS